MEPLKTGHGRPSERPASSGAARAVVPNAVEMLAHPPVVYGALVAKFRHHLFIDPAQIVGSQSIAGWLHDEAAVVEQLDKQGPALDHTCSEPGWHASILSELGAGRRRPSVIFMTRPRKIATSLLPRRP
jgi:hypothetical protein